MRIGRQWMSTAAMVLALGCGDKATGPGGNLQGTWTATSFTFTNPANQAQAYSLTSLGGTVTLTFGASTYSITTVLSQVGASTSNGTYTVSGNTFVLTESGSTGQEHVTFSFSNNNNTLSVTDPDASFDFDGDDVDEPATITAVFTRQ